MQPEQAENRGKYPHRQTAMGQLRGSQGYDQPRTSDEDAEGGLARASERRSFSLPACCESQ